MPMTSYLLQSERGPSRDRLTDSVVLVTGAASDVGRAVALSCAREGASVLLLDKHRKELDTVYDEILAMGLAEPVGIQETLNTLDHDRASALAEQIQDLFGRVDAVIHAAVEAAPLAPLEHFPPEAWNRVLHALITAPWILNRALLPLLRSVSSPRIVFTTGEAGRIPRAYFGATAIAWSAIDSMAAVLVEEFEHNESIRVFSIDPGEIDTASRTRWYPGQNPGTLPGPEDIADAYVFLASSECDNFTGPRCKVRDGILIDEAQV